MNITMPPAGLRRLLAAGIGGALLLSPVPGAAQDNTDARLRKVESEVRALQRRVFPGSDGRYFEPEITPAQPQAAPSTATASPTALTDALARLDSLERQVQQLTAQSEVNANALARLAERVSALETRAAAPASAPDAAAGGTALNNNLSGMTGGASPPVSGTSASAQGATGTPARAGTTPATAAAPSATRVAAVQAITKPATNDAADDEYVYGFRLYEAGFLPEAQQQLARFVEANPRHWRATYARNLLGRSYLDAGQARDAAPWFLNNYQADKTAARAGDSLLNLAQAMIALNDTQRACIALAEFAETYPALATGRLKSQYDTNRRKVTCN